MANSRKHVRLSLVIDFDSLEGKNVFKRRLDYVREVLTPAKQSDLDNYGLMSAIFDSAMYNKCSTAIKVVTYYYQLCN